MLPAARHSRRPDADIPATAMERHYSISEIAEKWSLPYTTVMDLFRDEEGIVRKAKGRRERRDPGRPKRTYSLIRIPESVMIRVYSRMVAR